jgi:hypothetical protein
LPSSYSLDLISVANPDHFDPDPAVDFDTTPDRILRSGQFRGPKGLGPLKKPREMHHCMFFPREKKIPGLSKSAVHYSIHVDKLSHVYSYCMFTYADK